MEMFDMTDTKQVIELQNFMKIYTKRVLNKINKRSNDDGNQINIPDILIEIETALKMKPRNKAPDLNYRASDMIKN